MSENVTKTAAWNPAITFIIRQALLNVTAIDEQEEPTAAMYEDGLFRMNNICKTLQATGLHVWTEEEAILFLQPGQARYLLGGTTTAHCCDAYAYVAEQVTLPAAATATVITVQDGSVFVSGANIGVVMSNGVTFWTTVSGAPAGNVVTLAAPLPVGVNAQALAYSYPAGGDILRPLKVPKARTLQWNGLIENPATVLSRQEYMDLPNKNAAGTPTQWFYDPGRSQGQMFIWNVPNNGNWAWRFTWYREIYDVTDPTNTMDFPQEWINCLEWLLSADLCTSYTVPADTFMRIEKAAALHLDLVSGYDRESEPVEFTLETWQYR